MTDKRKNLIGVFTFLPILFVIFGIIWFVQLFNEINVTETAYGGPDIESMSLVIGVWVALLLIYGLALVIFYIVDVVNNPKFIGKSGEKAMWIILILLVGWIPMVVYYFIEIRSRGLPRHNDFVEPLDYVD